MNRHCFHIPVAIAIGFTSAICLAQSAASVAKEDVRSSYVVPKTLVDSLAKLLQSTAGKECDPTKEECVIHIMTFDDPNTIDTDTGKPIKHCLAVAPSKINVPVGNKNDYMPVVWTLSTPDLDGGTANVEFAEKSGIVVTRMAAPVHSTFSLKEHIKEPKRGNGNPNDNTKTKFNVQVHQGHAKNTESTYFPIILFTPLKREQELCAAIDPKIVNI